MAEASSRLTATRHGLLLALAFAAGYIDALSYLGLGRVFTANMTGNTVLLGIAVAQLDGDAAARSSLALAGFVAGAAAGAWIVERDHSESLWPRAVMRALTLRTLRNTLGGLRITAVSQWVHGGNAVVHVDGLISAGVD